MSRVRGCLAIVTCVLLAFAALPASAQDYSCIVPGRALLDTSDNCTDEPFRDRAFDVGVFEWTDGTPHLILNTGNEIEVYNLDDPSQPKKEDRSNYKFQIIGDNDYQTTGVTVCDGCRYGLLSNYYEKGVIFDMGIGQSPSLGGRTSYRSWRTEEYKAAPRATFKAGTTQYVIAAGLPNNCGNNTPFYAISGSGSDIEIDEVGCVEFPGDGMAVGAVTPVSTDLGDFLYVYANFEIHGFEIKESGGVATLLYKGVIPELTTRLAFDRDNELLAVSDYSAAELRFYDVSNPMSPVAKSSMTVTDIKVSRLVMSSSGQGAAATLYTATGDAGSSRLFAVDGSGPPEEILEGFFSWENRDENLLWTCGQPEDAALSPDGTVLYLSWLSKHQVYNLGACLNPVPAVAGVEWTADADPVFPGDTIEVRNDSFGSVDEFAVWVTKEAAGYDPASDQGENGELVAGWRTPVADPDDAGYDHPVILTDETLAVEDGFEYWAHVRVDGEDPEPEEGDEYASSEIVIERDPTVGATVDPLTLVKGEPISLSIADIEGHPSSYEWVITGPGDDQTYTQANVASSDPLDEIGTWNVALTVGYGHEAVGGGLYTYQPAPWTVEVGPIAAAFTVSPDPPSTATKITFDGSDSRPQQDIVSYSWDISGPSAVECAVADSVECEINSDADDEEQRILPGNYTVTLVVENNDGDQSTIVDTVNVLDGSVKPEIDWNGTPTEGQQIQFTIGGLRPGDVISSVEWDFGEDGCSRPRNYTCYAAQDPVWGCASQFYTFSTGGPQEINAEVNLISGESYAADPVSFVVVTTGQGCEVDCSYNLSPSGATVSAAGGTRSFSVSAPDTCSWSVSESLYWVNITSGRNGSGDGTVNYSVQANSSSQRSGTIRLSGEDSQSEEFSIVQSAGSGGGGGGGGGEPLDVDFDWADSDGTKQPDRGESVFFTAADERLEIFEWDFGGENCDGETTKQCTYVSCTSVEWAYKNAGDKKVVMKVAGEDPVEHTITVRNQGECCYADNAPNASFSYSPAEPNVGEQVTFDASGAKSLVAKNYDLSLQVSNASPGVGETVEFTIDGLGSAVAQASWDFGGSGCENPSGTYVCQQSFPYSCQTAEIAYDSEGTKSVSVDVYVSGSFEETLTSSIQVSGGDGCGSGGGGEPTCQYTLLPWSKDVPIGGGDYSFEVRTSDDCSWSPTTGAGFVSVVDEGQTFSGNGEVAYSVAANGGTNDRQANITVATGVVHRIYQDGSGYQPPSDSTATAWSWTIEKRIEGDDQQVSWEFEASGTTEIFTYIFDEAGDYRVQLVTSNCRGSSQVATQYVTVSDDLVENFVVGAVSSIDGETKHWESDLRVFNPCGETMELTLAFFPTCDEGNVAPSAERTEILNSNATLFLEGLQSVFPKLDGGGLTGAVLVDSKTASNCKPMAVSRTFNRMPDGSSYGALFVPALPVRNGSSPEKLSFTGLREDDGYYTNLRFVNYGQETAWVHLELFDEFGGDPVAAMDVGVPPLSASQENHVARKMGVSRDLDRFSIVATPAAGARVDGFATVIDAVSGDSVLSLSEIPGSGDFRAWIPGAAHIEGKLDTFWKTDVWFFNPSLRDLVVNEASYISAGERHHVDTYVLERNEVDVEEDVAGRAMRGEESSGYLEFRSPETYDDPVYQIAARTFTEGLYGDTLGVRLPVFLEKDLLRIGDIVYIPGVRNNAGYRTDFHFLNTGVLNPDEDGWSALEVTVFKADGSLAVAEPWTVLLGPEEYKLWDIFSELGVGDQEITGSIKVEVIGGGGVAVFATEIDNQTGDSILIPAQTVMFGKPTKVVE